MPASVVKSPSDEKKWEKAKELAAEQGHTEDYAYIMGISKRMTPDRWKEAGLIQRVARRYAYLNGSKTLDGLGWEEGAVEENEFTGEGSIFPPGRDGQGGELEAYGKVPTSGLTKMLSKNKAPKTAGSMSHEYAMRVLRKENPDWPPSELEQVVGTTSPRMSPEARRVWHRYQSIMK
jgi:hypothetical protein